MPGGVLRYFAGMIEADRDDPELAELKQAVLTAEQDVKFHDHLLRTAVSDVQSLDRMPFVLWLRITGSHEAAVAEGIARVSAARGALFRVKANLNAAKAALDRVQEARQLESARARWREAMVAQRAAALRQSGLPAARDLLQLEAEIEMLETRIVGYDDVLQVANGLLASTGQVLRRADLADIDVRHRQKRQTERDRDTYSVQEALIEVGDRAVRLNKAVRAVGITDWGDPGILDERKYSVAEIVSWVDQYRRELSARILALSEERCRMDERLEAVRNMRLQLVNAGDLDLRLPQAGPAAAFSPGRNSSG